MTREPDRPKRLVDVFPREKPDRWRSGPTCRLEYEGCGRGPCGSETLTIDDIIRLLRDGYEAQVDTRVADYSTDESRARAAGALDAMLVAAGNELRVSGDNLSEVLKQAAPVIAVDGRIASIVAVPTRRALDRMLGAAG